MPQVRRVVHACRDHLVGVLVPGDRASLFVVPDLPQELNRGRAAGGDLVDRRLTDQVRAVGIAVVERNRHLARRVHDADVVRIDLDQHHIALLRVPHGHSGLIQEAHTVAVHGQVGKGRAVEDRDVPRVRRGPQAVGILCLEVHTPLADGQAVGHERRCRPDLRGAPLLDAPHQLDNAPVVGDDRLHRRTGVPVERDQFAGNRTGRRDTVDHRHRRVVIHDGENGRRGRSQDGVDRVGQCDLDGLVRLGLEVVVDLDNHRLHRLTGREGELIAAQQRVVRPAARGRAAGRKINRDGLVRHTRQRALDRHRRRILRDGLS